MIHVSQASDCLAGARMASRLKFLCLAVIYGLLGCDRTEELLKQGDGEFRGPTQFVATQQTPREILESVADRYAHLDAYSDHGYVKLRYELDGKPIEDRAPLAVAWQRSGKLGLRVYSVQAGPAGDRFRMRLTGEQSGVPNQVISRRFPTEIDFAWLMDDPLAAQSLSAGLAGSPPQLNLLFSEQPFGGLLREDSVVSLGPVQKVDGVDCQILDIQNGAVRYALWINRQSGLLRRIRIPAEQLPAEMVQDDRVANIQLTIELEQASASEQVDWSRFAIDTRRGDQLVTHFVPSPPPIDTRRLGKQIPAFELRDPHGVQIFDSRIAPDRKATVYIWLADHPACEIAARQFGRAARRLQQMNPELRRSVRFVPIWAEPNPPAGLTFEQIPKAWGLPGPVALDTEAIGRDLFSVDEAPTTIVLDGNNRLHLRESAANPLLEHGLAEAIRRLLAGEDLATATLRLAQQQRLRHAAELRMAAASDAELDQFPDALPYKPSFVGLSEIANHPAQPDFVALTSNPAGGVWALNSEGVLSSLDGAERTRDGIEFDTGWELNEGKWTRLCIDATGRWAACVQAGATTVNVFDLRLEEPVHFDLPRQQRPLDMRWLDLEDQSEARLAVITDASEIVVMTPSTNQLSRAKTETEPLAMLAGQSTGVSAGSSSENASEAEKVARVPHSVGQGGRTLIAMEDRTLQPLYLTDDQPTQSADRNSSVQTLSDILPARGSWNRQPWNGRSAILASGLLATNEPAWFLLDDQLRPLWHLRKPQLATTSRFSFDNSRHQRTQTFTERCSGIIDPRDHTPVWAVQSLPQTVHLLRADGRIHDHFRTARDILGLHLEAADDQLRLWVAHPEQIVCYLLQWPE